MNHRLTELAKILEDFIDDDGRLRLNPIQTHYLLGWIQSVERDLLKISVTLENAQKLIRRENDRQARSSQTIGSEDQG